MSTTTGKISIGVISAVIQPENGITDFVCLLEDDDTRRYDVSAETSIIAARFESKELERLGAHFVLFSL